MAVKMSRGHISQESMTEGLNVVQSRFALSRWEKLLAANLLVATQEFYRDSKAYVEEQHCRHDPAQGDVSRIGWQMHFIKGDATNCTATKGLKAHVVTVA